MRARQRSMSATISSNSSPRGPGAVGDACPGQRLAHPVGALEPRRRLLGRVADAGGVHLEFAVAGHASARGAAVDEPSASGGVLAVDRDDHLLPWYSVSSSSPAGTLSSPATTRTAKGRVALAHAGVELGPGVVL